MNFDICKSCLSNLKSVRLDYLPHNSKYVLNLSSMPVMTTTLASNLNIEDCWILYASCESCSVVELTHRQVKKTFSKNELRTLKKEGVSFNYFKRHVADKMRYYEVADKSCVYYLEQLLSCYQCADDDKD